jgi:hypothetical protein
MESDQLFVLFGVSSWIVLADFPQGIAERITIPMGSCCFNRWKTIHEFAPTERNSVL